MQANMQNPSPCRASVITSNAMILGDNTVNVAIGLSGISSGPQVQLEINTPGTSAGFGNSGFRLRDLTSLSISTLTGVTKFLTVTNMGDIVLGDIPGAGGFVGACSPGLTLAQTNYITKVSALNEICFSQIYDDGITVGIGVGSSVTSAFRFQVSGDFLLQPNTGTNTGDLYMRDNSTNQRVLAMYGQAGNSTLAIGPLAGGNSTTAQNNVYIGLNSGSSTGDEIRNTFVGAEVVKITQQHLPMVTTLLLVQ